MHWHWKSRIQYCLAQIPSPLSELAYFRLQRHFGNLRPSRMTPVDRLTHGFEICRQLSIQGRSPRGATFFEVGTGWRLNVPIALWLCGADRIVSVDVNKFLRADLIHRDLNVIRGYGDGMFELVDAEYLKLIQFARWQQLLELPATELTLEQLCDLLRLEYHAPADAGDSACEARSVDFHISCNTLEHIPESTLREIFREAYRIVRPDGLLLHRVDHSDHFSHADRSLSPINFLQFNDADWYRYAGNRFAYVNRLREDDYSQIFRDCGFAELAVSSRPNESVAELLKGGFGIDDRFRHKSVDTLARLNSFFILAPAAARGVDRVVERPPIAQTA